MASFCIAYVLLLLPLSGAVVSTKLKDVLDLSQDVTDEIETAWKLMEWDPHRAPAWEEDLDFLVLDVINVLLEQMEEVMDKHRDGDTDLLERLTVDVAKDTPLEDTLRKMASDIDNIESIFISFFRLIRQLQLERGRVMHFVDDYITHNNHAIRNLLENIHDKVSPGEGDGLLLELSRIMEESPGTMCHFKSSKSEILGQLATSLILVDLKGYLLLQASSILKNVRRPVMIQYDMETAHQFESMFRAYKSEKLATMSTTLKEVSDEFWMCDPKEQLEGETYISIKNVVSGIILYRQSLKPSDDCLGEDGCRSVQQHSCKEDDDKLCTKQRPCEGDVRECTEVSTIITACIPNSKTETSRYHWVKNGEVTSASCPGEAIVVKPLMPAMEGRCEVCFCICEEPETTGTERYFSLREVSADIEQGNIVTGIRFVSMNGIIYLQIQEGTALAHGEVDATTVSWKPVEVIQLTDPEVKLGEDYHKVTWDKRQISLDDIQSEKDAVLVGVRLRLVGKNLKLECLVSPIDINTGELIRDKNTTWMTGREVAGSSIDIRDAKTSISSPEPSYPDSGPGDFIHFTSSALYEEGGQTTIPLIDTQPVTPNPATWLSGVGIFHKAAKGYGGYIAIKVFTYNFSYKVESFTKTSN